MTSKAGSFTERNFFIIIALLMCIRLFHLSKEIDEPHSWRQCDTANYIDDFYKNGIDLLHPTVCWMGSRDTVILEFPLPEAIVATTYFVTGKSVLVARIVFLLFFSVSVIYLYKLVKIIVDEHLARLSLICYLSLPLSFYYSRAIHIDFFVIALCHAMVYCILRSVSAKSPLLLLVSSALLCVILLIKPPYVFYWSIPLFYWIYRNGKWTMILKYSLAFLPPVLVFGIWQVYSNTINSRSPDLSYIMGYRPMTASVTWYFGTIAQRMSLYSWKVLLQRGVLEVTGLGGIVLFLAGLNDLKKVKHHVMILLWLIAVAVYVLTFFNLNLVHNYYQLPLLAPASVVMGLGLEYIHKNFHVSLIFPIVLMLSINLVYSEQSYYTIRNDEIEMAQIIRSHTRLNSKVIVTNEKMDCRNPRLLYRSERKGWSVEELALNSIALDRLEKEQGADYWIYVGSDLPLHKIKDFLFKHPTSDLYPLKNDNRKVYIFDLNR